jgi:spoIIIJ-associated protein
VVRDNKPPEMDGALIIDGAEPSAHGRERERDDEHVEPQEDGKAELAAEMVAEIVVRMGLTVEVKIREDSEEEVILDIAGEDAGRVIGKKGQTLDALQFVINKIVNRFPEGRRHILLDSGDYRQRREDGLASLARREAKRALAQSRVITLEPMSPRDRRVVHLSLAKFPGVSTRSDGQGTDRRVRIIPARGQGPARQQSRGERFVRRDDRGPRRDEPRRDEPRRDDRGEPRRDDRDPPRDPQR